MVPVIADKVRSYGGEECRASRQSVGAGPAREIARRARSYMEMAWVGQRRSGSHPRIAPDRPAIADKVRYGGGIPCFPATCRSGPCPRFARRARSYRGMAWMGQRRSGSHPRIALVAPAIADGVLQFQGSPVGWVSLRSTPSYEKPCFLEP